MNLDRLSDLEKKATPAPWETDTYGTTRENEASIQIVAPGKPGTLLFESSNSDTRMIENDSDEDRTYYSDIGSRPNFELVCALRNESKKLIAAARALESLVAFVGVMFGQGPDATIPRTVQSPIGVPVKLGEIMDEARAALECTS